MKHAATQRAVALAGVLFGMSCCPDPPKLSDGVYCRDDAAREAFVREDLAAAEFELTSTTLALQYALEDGSEWVATFELEEIR